MATVERIFDRGTRAGNNHVRSTIEEFRERRLALAMSQQTLADAIDMPRSRYSRLESGALTNITIIEADRIATTLGLELAVRVFPGGSPLRDGAHAERLQRILKCVAPPLRFRLEVPLPNRNDFDRRAWDAMIFGAGKRTALEMEMRLRDGQAVERRVALKRRDDATDGFLLLIADTRNNRSVLSENPGLFNDLPRLRFRTVLEDLRLGRHPGSGLVLL